MSTHNQKVMQLIHLSKLKQEVLQTPYSPCLDDYSAACEEEATIHYINEEMSVISSSLDE